MTGYNNLTEAKITKAFLACGTVAGPLFVIVLLFESVTRSGYNPLRFPISSLALGEFGWIQNANFIVAGMLVLIFAIGLWRKLSTFRGDFWGPVLLGVAAIGLIGVGFFTTDPVYGFPPGLPLILDQYTLHGQLHDLFTILVFVCLPIACFVLTRRFAAIGEFGWVAYSIFTVLALLVTYPLAGMGFKQYPHLVEFAGMFQRLSVLIGWSWITLLALHLLRGRPMDSY